MATLPPGSEDNEKDVRIYLEGRTTKKSSLTNGNVQHVACVLLPITQMDSGVPMLVDASKNLLETVFAGSVTTVDLQPVHYELKINGEGFCWKCTSLGVFKIQFGEEFVIVELRESLHYT